MDQHFASLVPDETLKFKHLTCIQCSRNNSSLRTSSTIATLKTGLFSRCFLYTFVSADFPTWKDEAYKRKNQKHRERLSEVGLIKVNEQQLWGTHRLEHCWMLVGKRSPRIYYFPYKYHCYPLHWRNKLLSPGRICPSSRGRFGARMLPVYACVMLT